LSLSADRVADDVSLETDRSMNRAYWDSVASDYGAHVLSVFEHDAAGMVRERIERAGDADGRALDLGCGAGYFTELLAERFREVEACDHSEELLAAARGRCSDRNNVAFWNFDFVTQPAPFAPAGFVLCVNVLLMPELDERLRAWRLVTNQIAAGGQLLLVVPSHESMLYQNFRRIEWYLDEGLSCRDAVGKSVPRTGSVRELHQGVCPLEGIRTKHYLREELEVMLDERGFSVEELCKLEYAWSSLGFEAESEFSGPRPWDWLVQARRR
jgi:SAM-dependent methyltransferase